MENKASRVLIVDDMPINRMILSSLLATNGVLSDQVESGQECLDLCAEKDYDLILLDHRMPDLDGVDTLVRLKELFEKSGRSVPVVCHTTEDGRANINLYKAAGFADVLIKPIDPQLLSSVLMTYLPEEDLNLSREEKKLDEELAEQEDGDDEGDVKDELDKLPMWIKTIPHIDLVAGLANCETAEDYMDALFIFYSSIEEKASEIEFYLSHEDWTMYTLRVHSLKSTAALVGARKLSEMSKKLESAAKLADHEGVRADTPALLKAYREFADLLSPIATSRQIIEEANAARAASVLETPIATTRTVLFVQPIQSIVVAGIVNNLEKSGFKVITIPDEPDLIIANRFEADIILYMPFEGEKSHIGLTMNLLGEICQDDSKILCLTGDVPDIESAMEKSGAHRVTKCYPRPVNISHFIRDMKKYSLMQREFHRKKSLFIVDDDPDYLSVIEHWLSGTYSVSCFNCGDDLLDGLMAATPDLILLDYEMPEMDGYEIMKAIRNEESTKDIPIIFLTGKNDRDHVYRILEYKPDGYLLKTSRKDSLLDAIHRFFAEAIFKFSSKNALI